jgi:hypothetical protein
MNPQDKVNGILEKKLIGDSIRQEIESSLEERINRYLEAKPHGIIPNQHFASASSECSKVYRDGHFIACISLVQAVAESLVKFVCQTNGMKPSSNFERNIKTLYKLNILPDDLKGEFENIWVDRDNYHHLNPEVENDFMKLYQLAKKKLKSLVKLEKYFFDFTTSNGKINPKYPKYWTNTIGVFLRLE